MRRGMTLYEVVLALAIFTVGMIALSQSISTGTRASVESKLRTEAILRCESKMSDLLAGLEPMEQVEGEAFNFDDSSSAWRWSLEIAPGGHPDLLLLNLFVSRDGNGGGQVAESITRVVYFPPPPNEDDQEQAEE